MPKVELARHLLRFFPQLEGRTIEVQAATVAEAVRAVDALAPGFAGYVVDERGALRRHVNAFVGQRIVVDRATLADPLAPSDTLYVFQALSGG